jgi:transposase
MFVDFAGDTVPIIDAESGRTWQAHVFVSVLGASGYLYVEATRGEDLASWLVAHVRALEFYGASPRVVVVVDHVPRHIIRLLWPTGLCGRVCGSELESSARGWPHN